MLIQQILILGARLSDLLWVAVVLPNNSLFIASMHRSCEEVHIIQHSMDCRDAGTEPLDHFLKIIFYFFFIKKKKKIGRGLETKMFA